MCLCVCRLSVFRSRLSGRVMWPGVGSRRVSERFPGFPVRPVCTGLLQLPALPAWVAWGWDSHLLLIFLYRCIKLITCTVRPSPSAVCGCSSVGSLPEGCDASGRCLCRPEFQGPRCEQCRSGFHSYPNCQGAHTHTHTHTHTETWRSD